MSAKIIPFPSRKGEDVQLSEAQRDVILLAADEMIAKGGKELLVQVLKGMRSDLVLGAEAEKLRHFGALSSLTLAGIESRIDRILEEDLLRVEHYANRALLVHSPLGWERVKPLWAAILYDSFARRAARDELQGIYAEIGRVHREVKQLVLERIEREGASALAPVLEGWRERETKGMKRRISEVIERLTCASPSSSPR